MKANKTKEVNNYRKPSIKKKMVKKEMKTEDRQCRLRVENKKKGKMSKHEGEISQV